MTKAKLFGLTVGRGDQFQEGWSWDVGPVDRDGNVTRIADVPAGASEYSYFKLTDHGRDSYHVLSDFQAKTGVLTLLPVDA